MKVSAPGFMRSRVDWGLVGAVVGLLVIGSVAVLSAADGLPYYDSIRQRHFLALGMGVIMFMFGLGFNYQVYQDQAKTIFVLTLAALIAVLLVGEVQRGQRAWLKLPYFSFQPSEFARITTIMILAAYLDRKGGKTNAVKYILGAFAIVVPIMALILLEPDFSSTLSFFPLVFGMLFCAGASVALLAALVCFGAVTLGLPLAWTFIALHPQWVKSSVVLHPFLSLRDLGFPLVAALGGIFLFGYAAYRVTQAFRVHAPAPFFVVGSIILAVGLGAGIAFDHQLKGYQRDRMVAFLLPSKDPRGAAYNVQQAQIAIGSGGLWGKGVFSGTQSQLGFLPEKHTDFIYAVVGEEMGFAGAMAVLSLYLFLLWRIVGTARLARDRYGYLVCCGLVSIYGFYVMMNVGMCLGLVPVAGVQLPLVSYGGSSLVMTLFALGIVANIYSRRYAFY